MRDVATRLYHESLQITLFHASIYLETQELLLKLNKLVRNTIVQAASLAVLGLGLSIVPTNLQCAEAIHGVVWSMRDVVTCENGHLGTTNL
jgi:hypothetical protein